MLPNKLPALDEKQLMLPMSMPIQTKGEMESRRDLFNRLLSRSQERIEAIVEETRKY